MAKYHLGWRTMSAFMDWRLVCQHEQWNIVVPAFFMLINDHKKMLQEYPVEPFYHSIWLWMEGCSSGLVDLQLLAHFQEQIRCVQLQWDTIMWVPISQKDFGYFWNINSWYWICFTTFAEVIGYHKNMSIALSWHSPVRSTTILSNGFPTLYLCNLPRNRVCGLLVAAHIIHRQIQSSTSSL